MPDQAATSRVRDAAVLVTLSSIVAPPSLTGA